MTAPVLPDHVTDPAGYLLAAADTRLDSMHIAAEANPAHALAEAALWLGIVKRHQPYRSVLGPVICSACRTENRAVESPPFILWPCPDLLAAVEAARAYLAEEDN